jgi:hypothetical protein
VGSASPTSPTPPGPSGTRFLPLHDWHPPLTSPATNSIATSLTCAATDALHRVGLQPPDPDDDWRPFQAIGAALYTTGHAGLITTSAARPKAQVICLFRGPHMLTPGGVTFQSPAEHHATAPRIPRGLRT